MGLPSVIIITWLLINDFTIVIRDMDSAPHVEYSGVVPCGASADINSCPMDGLATISSSMSLLKSLNYKQTLQIKPTWNGFHSIALRIGVLSMDIYVVYLLVTVMQLLH